MLSHPGRGVFAGRADPFQGERKKLLAYVFFLVVFLTASMGARPTLNIFDQNTVRSATARGALPICRRACHPLSDGGRQGGIGGAAETTASRRLCQVLRQLLALEQFEEVHRVADFCKNRPPSPTSLSSMPCSVGFCWTTIVGDHGGVFTGEYMEGSFAPGIFDRLLVPGDQAQVLELLCGYRIRQVQPALPLDWNLLPAASIEMLEEGGEERRVLGEQSRGGREEEGGGRAAAA